MIYKKLWKKTKYYEIMHKNGKIYDLDTPEGGNVASALAKKIRGMVLVGKTF